MRGGQSGDGPKWGGEGDLAKGKGAEGGGGERGKLAKGEKAKGRVTWLRGKAPKRGGDLAEGEGTWPRGTCFDIL